MARTVEAEHASRTPRPSLRRRIEKGALMGIVKGIARTIGRLACELGIVLFVALLALGRWGMPILGAGIGRLGKRTSRFPLRVLGFGRDETSPSRKPGAQWGIDHD